MRQKSVINNSIAFHQKAANDWLPFNAIRFLFSMYERNGDDQYLSDISCEA